ncbi:MAG: hypothetical protein HN527_15785, partial [Rhodospirillaceae bacterium]|nr:hypothetical protein [Rhodospirillaceae bacterium]
MRQLLKTAFFFAPLVLLTLAGANPATAHAFGARYDLPVPLSLYLIGAGAAVALSFVVATVFVRGETGAAERLSLKLPLHLVMSSGVRWAIKLASAALFVLIIAAGLIGDQDPYQNLAPTMVWIIWWVGMAYVSAL